MRGILGSGASASFVGRIRIDGRDRRCALPFLRLTAHPIRQVSSSIDGPPSNPDRVTGPRQWIGYGMLEVGRR